CLTWCLTSPYVYTIGTCIKISRSDRTAEPRVNRIGHRRLTRLDGLVAPEEFVVFVVAAVPAAELGVVLDELNPFEPLHMSETMLQFVAQPQRRPVAVAHRFAVHVVG